MTTQGNADEHVQLLLGLYVLGALPAGEVRLVEEHLRWCVECGMDRDELADVTPFLRSLDLADVEDLAGDEAKPEP